MTGTTRATPALLWARAALLATVVLTASVVGHVSADGLLPGPLAMAGLLAAATVASAAFLTHQASPLRLVSLLVAGQAALHGVLTLLAGHDAAAGHGAAAGSGASAGVAAATGPLGTAAPTPAVPATVAERTGSYFDQVAAMHAATLEQLTASAASGAAAEHLAGHAAGHAASQSGTPSAAHAGWSHLVDHLAGQSPAMLLAHLVVVAGLGVWLAVGERALWTVLVLSTTRLHDLAEHALLLVLGHWAAALHERVHGSPVVVASRRDVVPLPHLLHHVVAHRGPPALLAA
ncbi:hypothetical protein [Nocardioides pakistanensis]